jgi:CNT family concentrative nucleoside transporter
LRPHRGDLVQAQALPLGIMLGGLASMLPERRNENVALAPRSVLVGFLATLLSAALIGLVTPA